LVIDVGTYDQYMTSSAWKWIRQKALEAAAHRCSDCESPRSLEVHHRHYESLGHEELDDLRVLCLPCHQKADKRRELAKASETQYWNGLETFVRKKYGRESTIYLEEFADEFDEWLESRDEEAYE
jgi:5-methylcytosine-specific restriction endonuclease McrA